MRPVMVVDKELATVSLALPRTPDAVLALLKKLLGLSEVQEIAVTPVGISVTRRVDPGAPIVPGTVEDTPVAQVLGSLDDIETLQPKSYPNPYLKLRDACAMLRSHGVPSFVVVFDLEEFAAFLGLERAELGTPPEIFGIPVHVMDAQQDEYAGKVVVLGGATKYLSDAKHGVVFDIGG